MHSQITMTAKYRGSKRNDSSAFSAAFSRMYRDPAEAEYARLKSEVLKHAGSSIAATPSKSPCDAATMPSDALPAVQGKSPNQENSADNAAVPAEEIDTDTPAQQPSAEKKPIQKPPPPIRSRIAKPEQKQGRQPPKREIKRSFSKAAPAAERRTEPGSGRKKPIRPMAAVKNMVAPAQDQKEQTEAETLRSRISGLNARVRKLELENAKLRAPIATESGASQDFSHKCAVNFSDPADDSRRAAFMKDKIVFLQNQVRITLG